MKRVGQNIRARKLFRPGQRILVGVSGGVDSLVLLHVLRDLAPEHGWRLTIAHFNHQLRGRSSKADERLVCRVAAKLGLPVVVGRADVRRQARAGKVSLEMAARRLRHDFLAATAARRRIPSIALAHHADDQVELFFLRLLRGSSGEGLGGMKWRSFSPSNVKIELVRPLLDQSKAALRKHAARHGIWHREDASNALLDFQRNRIRHELLPLLRSKYQPALDQTVSRVMDIVGAEAELAAQAAREWRREGRGSKSEGRRPKFEQLPVAVQRRCVQLQLVGQGIVPDFELVEALRLKADRPVAIPDRVRPAARGSADLHGRASGGGRRGYYAARDEGGLVHLHVLAPQDFRQDCAEVGLQGRAGEVEFGGVRLNWRICPGRGPKPERGAAGCEYFDADTVGARVVLRHWRPGDRFQPIGMGNAVKLQDFFTNQKVPREQRRRLVVAATTAGKVFWVEGMRISERFKLSNGTIRRLQWRWKRL